MEKQVRIGIGVFIFKNNKFLMGQRRGSHGADTWSIPGGHLEFGESFEETAEREVFEETKLRIKNIRFGAVTNDYFENENKHYVTIWMLSDWGVAKKLLWSLTSLLICNGLILIPCRTRSFYLGNSFYLHSSSSRLKLS